MDVANSSVGAGASGFYSSYCNFKKNIFIRPTIWTACAGNFVGFKMFAKRLLTDHLQQMLSSALRLWSSTGLKWGLS